MTKLEQVREEIAKIISKTLVKMYHGKISPLTVATLILSILIGGEIAEKCESCDGKGGEYSEHEHDYLSMCKTCLGEGRLKRPRTLRDVIGKEE
jgi:DnaJ-class molecular chaperone